MRDIAELQTYDILQLSFSDQVLRLGSNELLLKHNKPGTLGLLHLQLRNVVGNLVLAVTARLDTLFGVADGFQYAPGVVEGVRILVLLLAKLAEDDAYLVRDVRDGLIVGLFAPFGELSGDGDAFAAGGLVSGDEVVLALDEAVELS